MALGISGKVVIASILSSGGACAGTGETDGPETNPKARGPAGAHLWRRYGGSVPHRSSDKCALTKKEEPEFLLFHTL
ncbi:hypothetical protein AA14362_0896 [Acetobacter cerevisiae DSM 14362]|nr:hypothetical protein AA14362_0896 [Acetobacter cerevisiae DSM 14362]